jgi:hypothetical protein
MKTRRFIQQNEGHTFQMPILLSQDLNNVTPLYSVNQTILECVKKTLRHYGGLTPNMFLYNRRTKSFLEDFDIPSKPQELEECLDHMFDSASVIVKKAIVDELTMRCGLSQSCSTLKEAFELARKN